MKLDEIRSLWRSHGGDQHGPRVETWTIPEANVEGFVDDLLKHNATPAASGAVVCELVRLATLHENNSAWHKTLIDAARLIATPTSIALIGKIHANNNGGVLFSTTTSERDALWIDATEIRSRETYVGGQSAVVVDQAVAIRFVKRKS